MNTLFENVTVMDDNTVRAIASHYVKNQKDFRVRRISFGAIGALMLYVGISWLFDTSIETAWVRYLVPALLFVPIGLVFLWTSFFGIRNHQVRQYKKNNADILGQQRLYQISETTVYRTSGNKDTAFKLQDITHFSSERKFFFLMLDDAYLTLSKDGFTKGSSADFEEMLQQVMDTNLRRRMKEAGLDSIDKSSPYDS